MRITLRVIPSHSLPALPTLAILYATNTLEKNRENQMRKQPHFEKLFSPKMRFSPSRISPALPPAPNRSYSLRFPTSSHHLHHNRHEITTTFQRRSNDTSPTFQRNPFTTTRQFTPNHSNSYPIFIEYVPFYSRNSFTLPLYEHIRPQKEKGTEPFRSTPSRDALFFPVIARVQSCNNRENLHRNRQNSYRFSSLHFCSQC